ncbi:MAG: sugar transferase [Candidatus Promineofilum sp.]|nr:sugar transferase [Promineifilum sp.]MCW5862412.1 sugar transferase [Anaerolineae bacterium]
MNQRVVHWVTIAVDLLLINLGFMLAYVARYVWQLFLEVTAYAPYRAYLGQQLVLTVLLALTFQTTGVWRRRSDSWLEEVARAGTATAAGITLMMAVTFFFQPAPFSRLLIFWALVFIVLFIGAARLMRRLLLNALYRRGIGAERALVVGVGEAGRSLIRTLLARPDLGFAVAGYLDDGGGENNIGLGRIPRLGHYDDLERHLAVLAPVHTVFIALPGEMHRQMLDLLQLSQQHGARVQVVPDLLQLSLNRVEFSNMGGVPVLGVRDMSVVGHNRRFDQLLKRVLDLAIVILLGIPALILMAIVAIAIRLDSGGPVLYASPRVGRDGRPFAMYKFRSMVVGADEQKEALRELNEADGPMFKIRDDPRLTPVGRVIRRLSLDELPQIYNVLRGQMSLVGPRPPLPEEVAAYKPWHQQRLAVVGGLTGLWQVSGRSDLTFDELCLLDIYYIENWSLALDVRILLQTVPHLLSRRGAY